MTILLLQAGRKSDKICALPFPATHLSVFFTGCTAHPGIAKLVSRLVWECRGGIRDRAKRSIGKPCDACVCGICPDCQKQRKSGFDHINDHRQKKSLFFPLAVVSWQKNEYPGVAQLVGRDIWDVEVGCSSHLTRTKTPLKSLISEGFFLFFVYCGAESEKTIVNMDYVKYNL